MPNSYYFAISRDLSPEDKAKILKTIRKEQEEVQWVIDQAKKDPRKYKNQINPKQAIAKIGFGRSFNQCQNCLKRFDSFHGKILKRYIMTSQRIERTCHVYHYSDLDDLQQFMTDLEGFMKKKRYTYDLYHFPYHIVSNPQYHHKIELMPYSYILHTISRFPFCSGLCVDLFRIFTQMYNRCLDCRSMFIDNGQFKCYFQTVYRKLKPITNSIDSYRKPSLFYALRLMIRRGIFECPGLKYVNNFPCESCKDLITHANSLNSFGKLQLSIPFKDEIERIHPLTL